MTTAEDLDKALHEEDLCSICLDSFGKYFKIRRKVTIFTSPSCLNISLIIMLCILGENVEAENVLYAPNCSHKFHKECIMEWFLSQSSNLTCPDCRSQMFTVNELRAAATVLKDTKKRR